MRLLFAGDIAIPDENTLECFNEFIESNRNIFDNAYLIANIEGLVSSKNYLNAGTPVLFNSPNAIKVMAQKANLLCACLANNHTLDLPQHIEETIDVIEKNSIKYAGIEYKEKKDKYITFDKDGIQIHLINACWKSLLNHQRNPASNGLEVIELVEKEIIELVMQLRSVNSDSVIIVFLHWNFDLEVLPFPSHRLFAKKLSEIGANIVIGCHSHCVQPYEILNGVGVFYSIGNFLIPNSVFANGKLFFPEWASKQYLVDWNLNSNSYAIHIVKYSQIKGKHVLKLQETILVNNEEIKNLFPYLNNYLPYFKLNRRKKIFVPIYKDYDDKVNKLYDLILLLRGLSARLITTLGIRKWQN